VQCAVCRDEVAELVDVRAEFVSWTPPRAEHFVKVPAPAPRGRLWNDLPVWAQAAAAVFLVGVAAGAANVNVKYDRDGVTIRTGWMAPAAPGVAATAAPQSAQPASDAAPWREELAALENRLRTDLQPALAVSAVAQAAKDAASNEEPLKRTRALIAESERK